MYIEPSIYEFVKNKRNLRETDMARMASFYRLRLYLLYVHPMFYADFGMIDDHEIVSFLGRKNQVKISEILPLIQQWSVETNARFRPGYYALRILEAFFIGGHPSLWYADRLLLASVSALILYSGLLRFILPPFPAGVVTLLFFLASRMRYGRDSDPPNHTDFR